MNKEEIFSLLSNALSEEFEIELEKFTPGALIRDDLSLDSLDIVDVVVVVDSLFHLKFKSADFVGIKTFSDMVNAVFLRLNEK